VDLHEGKPDARRRAVGFGRDGRSVFYLTDEGHEFLRLVRRKLDDGSERVVVKDLDWDVEEAVISQDHKFGVLSVNAGGINELYRFDTQTLTLEPLKGLPRGIVGEMRLTEDGRRLALSINAMRLPWDCFVYDFDGAKVRRWTFSEVGGLDSGKFVAPELVTFKSFDGLELSAFVYRSGGKGRNPVVIYAHGGPEDQARPYFYASNQMWMDTLGVTIIEPNPRGSTGYGKTFLGLDNGFKREDSVADIGSLLDWIKEQPGLDSDRVAIIGGSYGGYMALASAVHFSDRLRAAIDEVGISNFVTFLENTKDYRRDIRRAEYGDERDPAMRDFLQRISPTNNVDKIRVPILVIQGQNDPRVPVSESEQMVAALRRQGVPVWYMKALNEGHGYGKKRNQDENELVQMLFLRHFLVGESKTPDGQTR